MNFSFQSKVGATTKPNSQKANGTSSKETGNFAEMIASLSKEGKITNDKTSSERPQGELLEKLEEVLTALQEIPKESLTPEEQNIMYAIVELLTGQLNQMEKLQVSEPGFGTPVTISPPPASLLVSSAPTEKLTMDASSQEKLMSILKQIDQLMKELSAVTTKPFEEASKLLGVEGKTLPADPKKLEQVFQQLSALLQQINTEQQTAGKEGTIAPMEPLTSKQVPTQEVEQMEQNKQLFKQLTGMTQDMDGQSQQESQTQQNNAPNIDASKPAPSTQPTQSQPVTAATPTTQAIQPLETVQTEQNVQPLTSTGSDTVKAIPAAVRPEAPAPTPTVRMSNLIEELSEVMQGSFRLNGNKEGSQIRVSIFPEHLGHLDIRLTELNGKIAAQIFTSSMVTKEALDLQINQLRNALMQQGVTVDRIEVTQQDAQQSFGQQNANPDQRFSQQQQKQGASRDKNGYLRIEEEAAMERKNSVEGMMKVDYTI